MTETSTLQKSRVVNDMRSRHRNSHPQLPEALHSFLSRRGSKPTRWMIFVA